MRKSCSPLPPGPITRPGGTLQAALAPAEGEAEGRVASHRSANGACSPTASFPEQRSASLTSAACGQGLQRSCPQSINDTLDTHEPGKHHPNPRPRQELSKGPLWLGMKTTTRQAWQYDLMLAGFVVSGIAPRIIADRTRASGMIAMVASLTISRNQRHTNPDNGVAERVVGAFGKRSI